MPEVNVKTPEQQDMQSELRVRESLIQMRTQISNQVRGLLAEYGIVFKQGLSSLRNQLAELFAPDATNGLSEGFKQLLVRQYELLLELDHRIKQSDALLTDYAQKNEVCQRLQAVEGIGVITSVAIVSTVGQGAGFKNGRHFAAYLGLVPRQHSSGNKEQLLGISKRGNSYLRQVLIHGARSVVIRASKKTDARSVWITQLKERCGVNKASVALANKNARIVMAMLLTNESYRRAA